MSDTASRNPGAAQRIADALLRSVAGTSAQLRIASATQSAGTSELGMIATTFANVVLSPVVLRQLRPIWQKNEPSQWELLVSASSVEQQIGALDLPAAQALFAITLSITVAGQEYLIDSVASNEAFGQVYLYRLLLREAKARSV